jgi:hypothetical protein
MSTSASRSASIVLGTGTTTTASQSSSLQYPLAARWLPDVQRRLSNSVGLDTSAPDGQWLAKGVVSAANTFFQTTSDLLPTEPFLYSSVQGDLVAEFRQGETPFTVILSSTNAVAMAVVGDQAMQFTIPISATSPGALRSEIQKITAALRAKRHGSVDSER